MPREMEKEEVCVWEVGGRESSESSPSRLFVHHGVRPPSLDPSEP